MKRATRQPFCLPRLSGWQFSLWRYFCTAITGPERSNRTTHRSMAEEIHERTNLVNPSSSNSIENENIKVYKRRWYILALFTLLNTAGNILWNTWPPIQETCQLVFGWTKTNVLIIGAVQAVGSIISVVPSSWLLDTKGKRYIYNKLSQLRADLRDFTDHFQTA